jgi:hypothetical protein
MTILYPTPTRVKTSTGRTFGKGVLPPWRPHDYAPWTEADRAWWARVTDESRLIDQAAAEREAEGRLENGCLL